MRSSAASISALLPPLPSIVSPPPFPQIKLSAESPTSTSPESPPASDSKFANVSFPWPVELPVAGLA
jgi:hypothetical protein